MQIIKGINLQKPILILFVMLAMGLSSFAQHENQISVKDNRDSTRIVDLSDKLSLWLYGINKEYLFTIANQSSRKHLDFKPNAAVKMGFGFNYKWLGLGFAFNMPWAKSDDDIYGHTTRIDLQINIFTRSFGMDMSAQYYKGYYISNPNDFMNWTRPQYPLLEDLSTLSTEVSGYYFTNNKKFSYRAAFVRNEIQKKSAGSFIIGSYLRSDVAESPTGFIPSELPIELRDTFNIKSFSSLNLGIAMGYTYTFVFLKNFFINLSLVPGIGLKASSMYDNKDVITNNNGISIRWVARLALGYEHEKFFLGITSISTSNTIVYDNLSAHSSNVKIRFFVGKRFNIKKNNKTKVLTQII
ncbi:MAG: hypothetical protein B6I18_05370 [Bacteroidetes bacterium 4572_112]|nr:MAG: hypothetical protein B6I18_05370 [Bacteroidetes bacterium 4572_112]